MKDKIIGVKGFNKDMTCKGMQYEEGKTYKIEGDPICCEKGYHFCENPIDCLEYYGPDTSVYHEVEALGKIDTDKKNDDTKIATNEIKIGARIDFQTMVKMAIDFTYKHCKKGGKGTKVKMAIIRTNNSVSSNTRNNSVSSNTGNKSVVSNTGDYSVASNTGDNSVASNTGDRSVSSNTGYKSVASNTGSCSVASNTGDNSIASNTGHYSVAKNLGIKGISSNLGVKGKSAGKKGTWLVLAEWILNDDEMKYEVKEIKTVVVDGKKIKEDTYYALEDGKFVEKGAVENEEEDTSIM